MENLCSSIELRSIVHLDEAITTNVMGKKQINVQDMFQYFVHPLLIGKTSNEYEFVNDPFCMFMEFLGVLYTIVRVLLIWKASNESELVY